jgi:hypothetical protein
MEDEMALVLAVTQFEAALSLPPSSRVGAPPARCSSAPNPLQPAIGGCREGLGAQGKVGALRAATGSGGMPIVRNALVQGLPNAGRPPPRSLPGAAIFGRAAPVLDPSRPPALYTGPVTATPTPVLFPISIYDVEDSEGTYTGTQPPQPGPRPNFKITTPGPALLAPPWAARARARPAAHWQEQSFQVQVASVGVPLTRNFPRHHGLGGGSTSARPPLAVPLTVSLQATPSLPCVSPSFRPVAPVPVQLTTAPPGRLAASTLQTGSSDRADPPGSVDTMPGLPVSGASSTVQLGRDSDGPIQPVKVTPHQQASPTMTTGHRDDASLATDCTAAATGGTNSDAAWTRKRSRQSTSLDACEEELRRVAASALRIMRQEGFTDRQSLEWIAETVASLLSTTS